MYAIYAFCRIVDDIADGDADLCPKPAGLAGVARNASRHCIEGRSDGR